MPPCACSLNELHKHATQVGNSLRQTNQRHRTRERVAHHRRASQDNYQRRTRLIRKTLRATDYTNIQTTISSTQAEATRAAVENANFLEHIKKDLNHTGRLCAGLYKPTFGSDRYGVPQKSQYYRTAAKSEHEKQEYSFVDSTGNLFCSQQELPTLFHPILMWREKLADI